MLRNDLTSAMIWSLSFLYLRSCEGVSAPLLSLSAMSWSCRRRSRLYSLAMLSKVSTTLGLSSASIAASESEFSISSSSKSASPGVAALPAVAVGRSLEWGGRRGRGRRRRRLRQNRGAASSRCRSCRDRLPIRADHGAGHRLGVGARIGRFKIDDVAQEDFALVELI